MTDVAWMESLRRMSWSRIVKGLAFDGGPSATKWVYLALNAVMALVVIMLAGAIVYGYVRDRRVDAGLLTAVVTLVGILQGCATNALNHRRTVQAQLVSGRGQIAVSDTPLTTMEPVKE